MLQWWKLFNNCCFAITKHVHVFTVIGLHYLYPEKNVSGKKCEWLVKFGHPPATLIASYCFTCGLCVWNTGAGGSIGHSHHGHGIRLSRRTTCPCRAAGWFRSKGHHRRVALSFSRSGLIDPTCDDYGWRLGIHNSDVSKGQLYEFWNMINIWNNNSTCLNGLEWCE